jgi:DNA-binding MurR/RpiR family transcriptional regulator
MRETGEAPAMDVHLETWDDMTPAFDLTATLAPAERADATEAEPALSVHAALGVVLARHRGPRAHARGRLRSLASLVDQLDRAPIERLVALLHTARLRGRRVFVLGTGESTVTASCFAGDLARVEPSSQVSLLQAITLTAKSSSLDWPLASTAERAARQLAEFAGVDDVLVAIAFGAEGASLAPVLHTATRVGAATVLLTSQGCVSLPAAELVIVVPTERLEHVHGVHLYVSYLVSASLYELERPLATPAMRSSPHLRH